MTFPSRLRRALILALAGMVPFPLLADDSIRFGHELATWRFSDAGDAPFPGRPIGEGPTAPAEGASAFDKDAFDDLQQRLKEMEDAWTQSQADRQAAEKSAAARPTLKINGRIHADYWAFPHADPGIGFFEHPDPADPQFGTDPEDRFSFRRIRLEASGDILETMLWRIQVDFNDPQSPQIKDVFIGFDELPNNQSLLIGNQKRPLGLDALNSSRYNVFLERPLAVEAFNEDARRPGITMYGHSDDESLGWAYGGYLLENISSDGEYVGDAYQASLNGRLWGSPWYDESSDGRGYFHWGLAGMFAQPDGTATDRATNENEARFRTRPEARTSNRWLDTGRIPEARHYEILGVESIVNVGALQLVGEYLTNWVQRDGAGGGPNLFFHGGYVYLSYFLTGEHIPYSRTSGTIGRVIPFENFFLVDRCGGGVGRGWGAWNIAVRYDYLDLTDSDITGGVDNNGTLAVNWFFTPYSKLQFNLIYGAISSRGPIGGFSSGEYLIAGTRLAIEF